MNTYQLKQDGELKHEGSENDCYYRLQRLQSQSADWAMTHEGWTITVKIDEKYKNNQKILKDRTKLFNERQGPRVGDYLELPNGLGHTRFTHDWETSMQTGGGAGSYYLGGGGNFSYSGGLDSGMKKADIEPTNETKEGRMWFFDQGYAGANRGVDFDIQFRVFRPKKGADVSGLPQIEAARKQAIRDSAETITRINGNGQEYILPVPEILLILRDSNRASTTARSIKKATGLTMSITAGYQLKVQPLFIKQWETVKQMFSAPRFKSTYYNNRMTRNTTVIKQLY